MSKALDMSLDDIIKQNKEKRIKERPAKKPKAHAKAREFAKPARQEAPRQEPAQTSKTSLFLTNLHFDVTNAQLREKAQEFGKLVRLGINWDRLGKSKGTAEIEYQSAEEAKAALEQLNGVELEGRPLTVKYARQQPSS
jgi:RNA recognition motif-containing protein